MYCNKDDRPIIKYKFGTGGQRYFKSNVSPINIITKSSPIPNTDSYNNEGYQISFYSPNNFRTLEYILLDYKLKTLPDGLGYGINDREILMIQCGESAFPETGPVCDINTIVKNQNIKCPTATENRCSIQIFNIENGLIFQDQGDCPVDFEVQCGNCPDGYIECQTSTYPGYCCISCDEVKNEIIAIKNTIKNLNNG